jgi:capsular exopolysaccharide synthesis family protein
MLHTEHSHSARNIDNIAEGESSPESLQFVYQTVLDFLHRQYPVIALATAIVIALGLIHLFTTPPTYTSTADLLIDTSPIRVFQQQSMFPQAQVDAGTVESQVEILKSDNIALAVIKKLNLAEDPEFIDGNGGLIGMVLSAIKDLFSSSGPMSEATATRVAVNTLHNRLQVERLGLTYIITIGFTSLDPNRAAVIANALADAYIDDQLESKYQAARRAGTWLQERLKELREQASTAQRAVVDFKNRNDMVDAGGRTINEQQLAELNSELVLAQSQTGEARAKVDRVQAILTSNSLDATVDATVADTLRDDVINKLRDQYLELARRESDWASKYGAAHLAVVNLRNQMNEIQGSIRAELQRIAETYKSDLEVATQRENSVKKQLNQAVSLSQVNNEAQVSLRELETNAQSYQALYDNFLQRYMESVQQQSFPITEARVISAASAPLGPSGPRTFRVLALALVAGVMIGVMGGAWREFADRVFRTRNQVEELLQTECIALVPSVNDLDLTETKASHKIAGLGGENRLLKGISNLRRGKVREIFARQGDGVTGARRTPTAVESDAAEVPHKAESAETAKAHEYAEAGQAKGAANARLECKPDETTVERQHAGVMQLQGITEAIQASKPPGATQMDNPSRRGLQDDKSAGQTQDGSNADRTQESTLVSKADNRNLEGKIVEHEHASRVVNELLQVASGATAAEPPKRKIGAVAGVYSSIVNSPFSAFAEAIRSVKMAVDLSPAVGDGKIIGFTSSVPNEGKSTIAVAVARLAAQTGARTLLIDCDLKNPSVSRALSPRATNGLLEVLKGQMSLENAIWSDDATTLEFLPVALRTRLAHSSEILGSEKTRKLFDGLRQRYDYIFLDFSPLMPIVDVRASTRLVDGYVYVIEWGKTRTDHVQNALRSAHQVYERLLGVVLNKVDLKTLGRYDGHGGSYYHHGDYYHRYGYTEA